ncbi:SPOR domain-containing protein [Anaerocolumna aminovalerica]|uniref:SPOR domain-containing protein n=1 Tax=Anaerocolumna aminovalerica TaxID=1527 RepID=UPI000BE34875|nr:SPOR domain-containing protein [Anaerocolumna aminovalerica]
MQRLPVEEYASSSVYVSEKEEKDVIYRVQVGAYSNQNNANKARERLKLLGYNAIVVASKR